MSTADVAERSRAPIQSVERAADVLALFVDGGAALDLQDITKRLRWSRATAHRYCLSLRTVGLLRYEPSTGVYGLGAKVIELGTAALESLPIVRIAESYLHELVAEIDRTAVITVWDGQAPVIVHVNDNTSMIVRISVRVGSRLPLFRSAQGHLYLALSRQIRRQFEQHPELRPLEGQLAAVREHGVSIRSEVSQGIRAIGAPVYRGNEIAATIAIVGTEGTVADGVESDMVKRLRRVACRLSDRLAEESA